MCYLTCSVLSVVLRFSVIRACSLVQTRIRGGAAVAQSAAPAAHSRIQSIKILRTLEALMVIPTGVQPAVAVLSPGIRYPQIPRQIAQQEAVQQAHHTGGVQMCS